MPIRPSRTIVRWNHRGFSLIETIVSMGILGIVIVSSLSTVNHITTQYRSFSQDKEEEYFEREVLNFFSNQKVCSQAFLSLDTTIENTVNNKDVLDTSANVITKIGAAMPGSDYEITSARISAFIQLFASNPSFGQSAVRMSYRKVSTNETWQKDYQMFVKKDGGNLLENCILGINRSGIWEMGNFGIEYKTPGNIGIGTNNPQVPLDIAGDFRVYGLGYSYGYAWHTDIFEADTPERVVLWYGATLGIANRHHGSMIGLRMGGLGGSGADGAVSMGSWTHGGGKLGILMPGNERYINFIEQGGARRSWQFMVRRSSTTSPTATVNNEGLDLIADNSQVLRINSNMHVGPYVASGFNFYVNGRAGGTTVWTVSSDRRMKKNIHPLKGALDQLKKFQAVSFRWIENQLEDLGFTAQQIDKVSPTLVQKGPKQWSVYYSEINALLVESIKELYQEFLQVKKKRSQIKKRYCQKYPNLRSCHDGD